jgi:hypothetical protein
VNICFLFFSTAHRSLDCTALLICFLEGWTNAKQLVSIWAQSGHEARSDPIRNADSNALFAVGAWLMVQPGAAPIGVDGSFTKPQATPKAKI